MDSLGLSEYSCGRDLSGENGPESLVGMARHHCISLLNYCHELLHTQIKFTQISKEERKTIPITITGMFYQQQQ